VRLLSRNTINIKIWQRGKRGVNGWLRRRNRPAGCSAEGSECKFGKCRCACQSGPAKRFAQRSIATQWQHKIQALLRGERLCGIAAQQGGLKPSRCRHLGVKAQQSPVKAHRVDKRWDSCEDACPISKPRTNMSRRALSQPERREFWLAKAEEYSQHARDEIAPHLEVVAQFLLSLT